MQFRTKQHHSLLKMTQNETCCEEGMASVDSDAEVVGDCDVEIVENPSEMTFKYSPLSTEVAQIFCNKFNLIFERESIKVPIVYGSLGVVCKTDKVVKDGNIFF